MRWNLGIVWLYYINYLSLFNPLCLHLNLGEYLPYSDDLILSLRRVNPNSDEASFPKQCDRQTLPIRSKLCSWAPHLSGEKKSKNDIFVNMQVIKVYLAAIILISVLAMKLQLAFIRFSSTTLSQLYLRWSDFFIRWDDPNLILKDVSPPWALIYWVAAVHSH